MIVTQIGSKQRRTVYRTRPVSKVPIQIMLPIMCVRPNLNAGIDCHHMACHLPLGFHTSIRAVGLISLSHDCEVLFTTVIGWGQGCFLKVSLPFSLSTRSQNTCVQVCMSDRSLLTIRLWLSFANLRPNDAVCSPSRFCCIIAPGGT